MNRESGYCAGKIIAAAAAATGAILSLWWCFLGPSDGWGLWIPVVAGGLLSGSIPALAGGRAERRERERKFASKGAASVPRRQEPGTTRSYPVHCVWPGLGRGITAQEGGAG